VKGPAADLPDLLDLYDRVVADAASHLSRATLAPVAAIGKKVRARRTLSDRFTIVGLAGGTGSGKSSLLNALVDEEVSPAGAMRPTTRRALAVVPEPAPPEMIAALEAVGVAEFGPHLGLESAILVLPDIDSLQGHRHWVDEILPYLDLVVWVVDPEKYRDRILHEELLRPLAVHQGRFRFVLNQIDRVSEDAVTSLRADLERSLASDGISRPLVWATAADPPSGPPLGIEEVRQGLTGADRTRRPEQMVAELRRGARILEGLVAGVGFQARWPGIAEEAAGLLGTGERHEARLLLARFLDEVAPSIDLSLERALDEASSAADPIRALDRTLGRSIRDFLRPRARTRALLTELELALAQADDSGPMTEMAPGQSRARASDQGPVSSPSA
jgi:ABC-type hemin transport system ATPase subunit